MSIETNTDYAWYRSALAGEKPPVHEGRPECGYFSKGKGSDRVPAAIWIDGQTGEVVANAGFANTVKPTDAVALWSWVCGSPISERDYWTAYDSGGWPNDMAPPDQAKTVDGSPMTGDNRPPEPVDPAADLKERIETAIAVIKDALTKDGILQIPDQAAADKAANARDRLRQLWNEGELARVAEKRPHDEAAKAVQAKWKPILELADGAAEKLTSGLTAYLRAEQRRQDELAEAQRRAAAAEAAAFAAAAAAAEQAGEAPPPAPEPEPVREPVKVRVGGAVSGRRAALTKRKVGKITDMDAFFAAVKGQAEIVEALQAAANRAARAGIELAGMVIETEESA